MVLQKLGFKRTKIKLEDPKKRVKGMNIPVILPYSDAEGYAEAVRCLGCGLCISGCPDRIDIPGFVKAIAEHDTEQAVRILFRDLPLPLVCGYICTHRCEDACVYKEPIAIKHLHRFAAEHVQDYYSVLKDIKREPDTGKKVAIIGAGPGGLAVAYYLTLRGVKCTIFEELSKPGGLLMVGIPRYRLPYDKVMRDINFILSQGIEIKYNTKIGRDVSFSELLRNFDAVYFSGGNTKPRMTGTKGSDGKYVYHALEFLKRANLNNPLPMGDKVVVVGGGFTAMDSVRTALRLGAKKVVLMYRRRAIDRPGYPSSNADEELEETIEEGVEFMWEVTPFEYVKDKDRIVGVRYWKNQMIEQPGKRAKPVPMKDKEYFLEANTIIEATGQTVDFSIFPPEILNILTVKHNEIVVNEMRQTSIAKLFAGGDAVNKTKDVISAVADANKAVEGILKFLGIEYHKVIKPEWERVCEELNNAEHQNIPCTPYYQD